MRNVFKAFSCLAAFTLAACSSGPTHNWINFYVDDQLGLSYQEREAKIERELALAVPDADKSYAFNGGVWSASPDAASPVFRGGTARSQRVPMDRLRRGGSMHVTVQFDMGQGVPIYHVILHPIDFSSSVMDDWPAYVVLDTGLNKEEGTDEKIYAPLANAARTDDGRLITQWVYCGSCLADGPEAGDDAQLERLRRYAKSLRGVKLEWPTYRDYRRLSFADKAPADLIAGSQAVQTARLISKDAEGAAQRRSASRAQSADGNRAYTAFFKNVYQPLTFEEFADQSDCPDDYAGFSRYGNVAETHAKEAREAERYARCQARLLEDYDLEGYMSRYPGLVEQEKALYAKTFDVKRRKILTPQQQVNVAKDRIETAYDNADRSWDLADTIAENRAKSRAEAARAQEIFTQNQARINAWQRSTAAGASTSASTARASAGSAASTSRDTGNATSSDGRGGSSGKTFTLQRYDPVEIEIIEDPGLTPRPDWNYDNYEDYSTRGPSCEGCVVVH